MCIIPCWIRYSSPDAKSESDIIPCDHHLALFFIQCGIGCDSCWPCVVCGIDIMSCSIMYFIPETNSESLIVPSDHHFAKSFTQSGIETCFCGVVVLDVVLGLVESVL